MSLSEPHSIPLELREAVNRYLGDRLKVSVISTSAAAREVRASVPECDGVTERELVDYIARRAVEAGLAVSFDGGKLPQ
jgi:hypothetical protein